MLNWKNNKLKKILATAMVSAVTLCGVMGIEKALAADITSGDWFVYYNSGGSYDTGDYVILTVRKTTFSAKCGTLNNSNLAVDFTNNNISPAGDGSLIFTSTGKKRFTFSGVDVGTDEYVNFKLVRSGNATGLARGSAKKGTY